MGAKGEFELAGVLIAVMSPQQLARQAIVVAIIVAHHITVEAKILHSPCHTGVMTNHDIA